MSLAAKPRAPTQKEKFLLSFLKPYFLPLSFASFASLMLGLLAAVLACLIGPALRALMSSDAASVFSFKELFGELIAKVLTLTTGLESISQTSLMTQLPPFLALLALCRFVFSFFQSYYWEKTAEQVCKDLRAKLLSLFLEAASLGEEQEESKKDSEAELVSLVSTDIRLLKDYFVHFYGGMPRELLQILCLAIISFALSVKLFCLFFFFMLPTAFVLRLLGKKLQRRSQRALADSSSLSEWFQHRLDGIETIKHYKSEANELEKMQVLSQKNYQIFLRAGRVKARTAPATEWFAVLALVVVFFIALSEIQAGALTASIALSFFAQMAFLSQSASTLGRYFNQRKEGQAAVERVFQAYLDFSQKISKKNMQKAVQTHSLKSPFALELKNISLSYGESEVFQNFSWQFKKGEITAICGPSGSGKTSLVKAILGLKSFDSGAMSFHPHFLKEKKAHIGYMPQKLIPLHGSIAENICYPQPYKKSAACDQKIYAAFQLLDLGEQVAKLEQGLDACLGRGGLSLSGGQLARLFLARLYFHDYSFLIIDEPTASLDPIQEANIYALLKSMQKKGLTILIISHRKLPEGLARSYLNLT